MIKSNNQKEKLAIGIDIGGTKIEAALVSLSGEIFNTLRVATPSNYQDMSRDLLHLIHDVKGDREVVGIGMSIPGSIDPDTKRLRNAPNSPAINGTDFFEHITRQTPLPVILENDANCLVLSEYQFGVARGCHHVVGIILGTGVGAGVILDRELVHGSSGLAPELGHTIIDINGRPCLCGNQGCVEAYLSGPSLLKRFHEAGGDPSVQDAKIFFSLAHDPIAQKIIEETKIIFSRFVAAIVSMYDPEVIVLGGGVSQQKMFYECEKEISKFVFGSHKVPLIKRARGGDASGKLGAAALVFQYGES